MVQGVKWFDGEAIFPVSMIPVNRVNKLSVQWKGGRLCMSR